MIPHVVFYVGIIFVLAIRNCIDIRLIESKSYYLKNFSLCKSFLFDEIMTTYFIAVNIHEHIFFL